MKVLKNEKKNEAININENETEKKVIKADKAAKKAKRVKADKGEKKAKRVKADKGEKKAKRIKADKGEKKSKRIKPDKSQKKRIKKEKRAKHNETRKAMKAAITGRGKKKFDVNSVSFKLMMPLIIVACLAIVGLVVSNINLYRVDKAGEEISDKYLKTSQLLGDMQLYIQRLQKCGFAYVSCTGEDTLVPIVQETTNTKNALNQSLVEFYDYVVESGNEDAYIQMQSDLSQMVIVIDKVKSYASVGKNLQAIRVASGDLTTIGNTVSDEIMALSEGCAE